MWMPGQDDGRFKQIDSLKHYFSTVKEVSKDTLYEIPIVIPTKKIQITLRVNLPRDFPRVPPLLQIFPPVQHRFVDQQMFVLPAIHFSLQSWSQGVNLGKTIYEVIQRFMQEPPNPLPSPQQTSSNPPPYGGPISPSQIPTSIPQGGVKLPYEISQPPQHQQQQQQRTHTPLPVVPASFPELDSKNPSELSQLLNDENEFQKFFESLTAVQTMKKLRDDLRDNNELLAKRTLEKEKDLESLKSELDSKLATVNEKRTSFEQKAQRQQEIMKQYSTPALIEQLGEAAQQAENESDELAKKFLKGEVEQKDFIREFMEKRKLYHLRAAKKESLMLLVNR